MGSDSNDIRLVHQSSLTPLIAYIVKGSDTELELSLLYNTGVGEARNLSIEQMISLVKTKQRPILPFFRALNPTSTYSGINNLRRENKEVLDTTVSEQIKKDFYS